MNKQSFNNNSNLQYQRRLTRNSYNQDFIYYQHNNNNQKQISKSPKYKIYQKQKNKNINHNISINNNKQNHNKSTNININQINHNKSNQISLLSNKSINQKNNNKINYNHNFEHYQLQDNHNKIQSMKNTLQSLFIDKSISSSSYSQKSSMNYNKSVNNEYNNQSKNNYNNYQFVKYNGKNHSKSQMQYCNNNNSVSQNITNKNNNNIDNNFNKKLDILTNKLREIAQRPYMANNNSSTKNKNNINLNFSQNSNNKDKNTAMNKNNSSLNTKTQSQQSYSYNQINNFKKHLNSQQSNNYGNQNYQESAESKSSYYFNHQLNLNNKNKNKNKQKQKSKSKSKSKNKNKSKTKQYKDSSKKLIYENDNKINKNNKNLNNIDRIQIQTISQTTSLQRNPKNYQKEQIKNQKSISIFENYKQNNSFDQFNRPRGKTMDNITNISQIQQIDDEQNAKIKINLNKYRKEERKNQKIEQNNYEYNKNKRNKTQNNNINAIKQSQVKNLNILLPHRASIRSIIINSDGKRFLTASNDYTIKQSIINGQTKILRHHQTKINIMKMIQNKLYSGGEDCKVKYQENQYFKFKSPVLQIYPHQKEWLNIGTNSNVQLFNIEKRKNLNTINVKTKFYQLFQKINKQVYFCDNHKLSIIDWRVPYPLITLKQEQKYINKWISNPYSTDFFKIINNCLYNSNQNDENNIFLSQNRIIDSIWKKDKFFILTQNQLNILQPNNNSFNFQEKIIINEQFGIPSSLQVKNNIWSYGTTNGRLIVNILQ